jgi:hypothetical protein
VFDFLDAMPKKWPPRAEKLVETKANAKKNNGEAIQSSGGLHLFTPFCTGKMGTCFGLSDGRKFF